MHMTTKITAAAIFACVACLYVFSNLVPNDPYFYLVSSNSVIATLRLVLGIAIVSLALKQKFNYRCSTKVCRLSGLALIAFGLAGLIILPLSFALSSFVMPFDFIFALGSGLFLSYMGLALKPGKSPLPKPQPYFKVWQPRLLSRFAR